ncbi:MAG: MFS transporter [Micrococcales bacterium]|nr:MFS transporter [Micrococcales bacterium]
MPPSPAPDDGGEGARAGHPHVVHLPLSSTLVLIGGMFLPMLSFFVVNVALHDIGEDLHASPAMLQLVVGAYGIANAALVVVGGRLGDSHGRRRMFLVGMTGFALASLACALAPTMPVLLAGRVAQGALAALMTPQVLSTISATLTGPLLARALGLVGASGGIAAAAGQVVGGALVDADLWGLGWRSVFAVFVPLALGSAALAARLLPETRSHEALPIDLQGATLLGTTLVLLMLPLTEGRPLGWPVWIVLMVMAALVLGAVFLAHQHWAEEGGRHSLVPPSVLRLAPMRRGLLVAVCHFTAFGGFMFAFAIATQAGAGMTPLEGGLTLLPMAVVFMGVSLVQRRVDALLGSRTIAVGWAVQLVANLALAAMVLAQWPNITPWSLAPALALVGLGSALVMMPMFSVVLAQVSAHQAGLGSGILITTQQTCLALGAAVVGTLFFALTDAWGMGPALAVACALTSVAAVIALPSSLALSRP